MNGNIARQASKAGEQQILSMLSMSHLRYVGTWHGRRRRHRHHHEYSLVARTAHQCSPTTYQGIALTILSLHFSRFFFVFALLFLSFFLTSFSLNARAFSPRLCPNLPTSHGRSEECIEFILKGYACREASRSELLLLR